jgi:hypothetical protein
MANCKKIIVRPKRKMGRPPKYKTQAERKAAFNATREARNAYARAYYAANKKTKRNNKPAIQQAQAAQPALQQADEKTLVRIKALEEENREILLTLDEVLKDCKKLMDFAKYGRKPQGD